MKKNLIYDLGMHEGEDAEFYLSKGFDVVAVEANPFLCKKVHYKLKKYTENNKLKIINKGVGELNGRKKFYINKNNSVWSSFIEEIGRRNSEVEEIEIDIVSLESLIQEYGVPFYLKIDLEGYDYHVLKGLTNLDIKPQYVSVEVSNDNYHHMLNLFTTIGYNWFKIIDQSTINKIKIKDWSFVYGSSGPFGEDSIGEWKNYDEAVAESKNCFENIGQYVWYDIHAKL